MRLFAAILVLLYSLTSLAEYRVFTLHIIEQKSKATRQVETTLDPEQYRSLYPLKNSEEITYIETWWCKGNTSHFKAHCDNPRLKLLSPQSLDQSRELITSQSPEVLK
jgi:hypothetical protein